MCAKSGRVYIAFKALMALTAWFFVSWGWFFTFYVTAYTAAGDGSSGMKIGWTP
jgi:hypothetical protein